MCKEKLINAVLCGYGTATKHSSNLSGGIIRKLLILGAGSAGTMVANKMVRSLSREWQITLVDQHRTHYYQPGFLFVPFGIYTPEQVQKPRAGLLKSPVELINATIEKIVPEQNQVELADGRMLDYEYLVIATGARTEPGETEGMEGPGWRKNIFDFYTFEGACGLAEYLSTCEGGKLVVSITEMPIKCPVAPLEFIFLADAYFTKKGIRDKVDITFVTPLPGAFTRPLTSKIMGDVLKRKNIKVEAEFATGEVDSENNKLISWDEREIEYDLLVPTPVNMGDALIERSGLGDELNFVPTDKGTLRSKEHENIFVIGDATDVPTSKAGSVAHFEADILQENLLNAIAGRPLSPGFDGHSNCFIESGFGKGYCIDFNYDTEPLLGKYPLPILGPFSLLKETRMNHLGKMMFKSIYWKLMKGMKVPIKPQMSMRGKRE